MSSYLLHTIKPCLGALFNRFILARLNYLLVPLDSLSISLNYLSILPYMENKIYITLSSTDDHFQVAGHLVPILDVYWYL